MCFKHQQIVMCIGFGRHGVRSPVDLLLITTFVTKLSNGYFHWLLSIQLALGQCAPNNCLCNCATTLQYFFDYWRSASLTSMLGIFIPKLKLAPHLAISSIQAMLTSLHQVMPTGTWSFLLPSVDTSVLLGTGPAASEACDTGCSCPNRSVPSWFGVPRVAASLATTCWSWGGMMLTTVPCLQGVRLACS